VGAQDQLRQPLLETVDHYLGVIHLEIVRILIIRKRELKPD
jgi:hypothetical protein